MQFLLDTADTPLERGSSRVFRLPVADSIGPLRRLHIEKQMSQGYDPGRGWYLKQVLVENPVHGERVLFPCNSWLGDSDCGGYKGRWWAPPVGLASSSPLYSWVVATADEGSMQLDIVSGSDKGTVLAVLNHT